MQDLPNDLASAIEHAVRIVSDWEPNLTSDEMPPRWMWPFPEELEGWFEDVRVARKEQYGGDHDDEGMDTLVDNELAPRARRR